MLYFVILLIVLLVGLSMAYYVIAGFSAVWFVIGSVVALFLFLFYVKLSLKKD